MKFTKHFFVTLLFATVVVSSSCNKKSDDVQQAPTGNQSIAGKWVGAYGFGNNNPAIYYSFNVKADGTIEELSQSGQSEGSGTWKLTGNSFTAKYQWNAPFNTVFSVEGTYNSSTKKLTGTWGYDNNATDGGKWEQTKQ
jgi:hypothetical protein